MNTNEYSENGTSIYRYNEPYRKTDGLIPDVLPDIVAKEKLKEHIEKHIGKISSVHHELTSSIVHIDLYYVSPTEKCPFHTFITSGMSDLAMNAPEGEEEYKYAELMVVLPKEWTVSDELFKKEENYFPIENLKMLSRFPHAYNTFFGFGHTIDNGQPSKPYASNTKLESVIFLPPIMFGEDFSSIKISEEKTIHFYNTIYLYKEEVQYKLKNGINPLFDLFDEYNLGDVLNINRCKMCK